MSNPRTFIGLYLLFLASVTSLDLSHTQRLRRDSQDGVLKDDNSKAKNTLVKLSKDDFGGKLKDVFEGHKKHNDKDDNIEAFHMLFEELDELADQLPDDLYDFDITRYISQTSPGPKQAALHDLCLKNSTRLRIFLSQVHETISSVLNSAHDDLHKTSRDKDDLTTDNDYTPTIQPTVTDDDSKEDDSTVTSALVSSQPSDDNSRDRDSFDTEDVFEKLSEDSMECLSAFFDDDDEKFLCRQFSHQSTRVFSTLIQAGAQCTTLLDDDDDDDDRTIPASNGVNVRFQHHDEFETFFRHSFSQSNTFFDTGEDDGEDLDDGHQRVLLHQFMKTTPPSNWTSQDLRRALVFTSDVLDDDFLEDLSDDLFDDNLSLLGKVATRHRANPALQLAFRQRVKVRPLDQLDSSAITSLGRGLLALSEDDFDDLNPLAILNANLKDLFDDINDPTHDDDDDDDDRVRLALGHRMRQANVSGKDVGKLARFLYDDLDFMESVDADDLFENVKELDDLDLDDDQAAFLFRRVSQAPSFPSPSQFTRTHIQHLKPVLPGMGLSMLQQLPVAVVKESLDFFKDIDFGESQARELLDEILDFEPQEMTSEHFRSFGHLARGLDTDDIDDLDDDVISEVLDDIDDMDFNDAQKRLFADKARHFRNQPGVLALLKLPGFSHAVSIDDIDDLDDDEIVSTLNISTKTDWRPTQASALLVKVKESKVRSLRPSDLPGLGTLARGLLPRDLDDMLERSDDIGHIADVLGDREDDLSSSVVDNLVEKIIDSDHFDDATKIRVTATYVAQKGAFLPYLSKDDFNKLEFDDDGKDAFVALMSKHNTNKLPRGQLHFLAENLLDMMKVKEKEDQDTADSRKLRLLGEFVLGLPAENLKAFSALAILNNLGTLGTLPFTRLQARVLLDKLDSVKEDWHCRATILASVGPLLQHADDDDIKNLCDEGLASSMSIIQRRMQQHHERVEERHEEGLWREDTLDLDTDDEIDEQTEDDDHKKQLVNRMILAAIDITFKTSSTGRRRRAVSKLTCSILRQMRQDVVLVEVQRLKSMEKTEFHDCLEVLGNASKWDSNALASLVTYAKEVFGPPSTWTNERIRQAGALIAGLSVDEIRTLNVTGVDALYSVGRHALLSVPQLMAGLDKWLNFKYAADVSKIRPGEFSSLSEFVCGLTTSQIANLSRDAFKQSLDVIGHARSCTPDQVKAYVHLAMDVYNTSVTKWPPAVVGEMGILIGGMSSTSIHEMTKDQLALVTPSVIAKLPQTVLKEMSEVQLSHLSTNQINSLSRSQYDALAPSQKKIVDAKATVAFTQATGTTTMQPGSAPVTDVGMTRQNNDSSLLTQSTVLQTPTTSPRASSVMIENKSFPSSQLPKVEVPAIDMGELHQNGIQKATDLKSTMSQFLTPPPTTIASSQTQKEVPMTYSTRPSGTDIIRRIEIQSLKPVPAESGKASLGEITTQKTSGLPTSHKLQTISLKVVPTLKVTEESVPSRVTHEVVPSLPPSSNQTTPGNKQAASEKTSEAVIHSPARSSSVKSDPAKTDTENRFNAHSSTADVSPVSSSSRQETSGNKQGSQTASGSASQHSWGMVALLTASLLHFLLS